MLAIISEYRNLGWRVPAISELSEQYIYLFFETTEASVAVIFEIRNVG